MEPLHFRPIIKRALWGGGRLEQDLGKDTGGVTDAAESWEISDLPGNHSVVEGGAFHGASIRDLMNHQKSNLLGPRFEGEQFPLMVKFLDAEQQLSIQVHPKNPVEQPDGTMRAGKAEAWIVLDAAPGSQMLLGLKPDVTETDLRTAAAQGNIEQYLQSYHPHQGDFIFLPPGTIHSLGGGILIAEVQQPSDVTYRLHDWNRRDASGRCRELHLEQAILTADLAAPPVLPHPQNPAIQHETLLHSSHFAIHRHCGFSTWSIPQDERFHVIVMLFGRAILRQERDETLQRGQTIVLPACRSSSELLLEPDAVLLDIFLPAPHEL